MIVTIIRKGNYNKTIATITTRVSCLAEYLELLIKFGSPQKESDLRFVPDPRYHTVHIVKADWAFDRGH